MIRPLVCTNESDLSLSHPTIQIKIKKIKYMAFRIIFSIYAPINNVFYLERLKFVWHQNRKSHNDLWIFVVRFCYIRHERIFFFSKTQKRGITAFYENFKFFKSHPFIEFYFIREEGERYKKCCWNVTYALMNGVFKRIG